MERAANREQPICSVFLELAGSRKEWKKVFECDEYVPDISEKKQPKLRYMQTVPWTSTVCATTDRLEHIQNVIEIGWQPSFELINMNNSYRDRHPIVSLCIKLTSIIQMGKHSSTYFILPNVELILVLSILSRYSQYSHILSNILPFSQSIWCISTHVWHSWKQYRLDSRTFYGKSQHV